MIKKVTTNAVTVRQLNANSPSSAEVDRRMGSQPPSAVDPAAE